MFKPKFKYKDKVEVIKGFHKGRIGWVVEQDRDFIQSYYTIMFPGNRMAYRGNRMAYHVKERCLRLATKGGKK